MAPFTTSYVQTRHNSRTSLFTCRGPEDGSFDNYNYYGDRNGLVKSGN